MNYNNLNSDNYLYNTNPTNNNNHSNNNNNIMSATPSASQQRLWLSNNLSSQMPPPPPPPLPPRYPSNINFMSPTQATLDRVQSRPFIQQQPSFYATNPIQRIPSHLSRTNSQFNNFYNNNTATNLNSYNNGNLNHNPPINTFSNNILASTNNNNNLTSFNNIPRLTSSNNNNNNNSSTLNSNNNINNYLENMQFLANQKPEKSQSSQSQLRLKAYNVQLPPLSADNFYQNSNKTSLNLNKDFNNNNNSNYQRELITANLNNNNNNSNINTSTSNTINSNDKCFTFNMLCYHSLFFKNHLAIALQIILKFLFNV